MIGLLGLSLLFLAPFLKGGEERIEKKSWSTGKAFLHRMQLGRISKTYKFDFLDSSLRDKEVF